jgi:hypothetical protein
MTHGVVEEVWPVRRRWWWSLLLATSRSTNAVPCEIYRTINGSRIITILGFRTVEVFGMLAARFADCQKVFCQGAFPLVVDGRGEQSRQLRRIRGCKINQSAG